MAFGSPKPASNAAHCPQFVDIVQSKTGLQPSSLRDRVLAVVARLESVWHGLCSEKPVSTEG
jgi:hypothetical protein